MVSSDAVTAHEQKRLDALRETGLLDSPREESFDRLTNLATKVLDVPVALVTLIDSDRQFFKSESGLPKDVAAQRETPLTFSFCQYVAALGEPLIVNDARESPLLAENRAMLEFNVTAYAGIPLFTDDGYCIGSFCAIDMKPRGWTQHDIDLLKVLAAQAMTEINLRKRLHQLGGELESHRSSEQEHRRQVRQNIHDFRTPVTSILVSLDGIEVSGPMTKDQRTCIDLAKKSARDLRDLINQLLELSQADKKREIAFAKCEPHEIVESAVEQVAPLAQRAGIEIDDAAVTPQETICADKRGLKRVFVNLLANAVKFTPRGGRVAVVLDQHCGTKESKASIDDCVMRLIVADNGIGIEEKDRQRIFEDGVRVNQDAPLEESTGVGLGYCKRVVEKHGGEIEVQSAPGRGSVFTVTIPQNPPEEQKT